MSEPHLELTEMHGAQLCYIVRRTRAGWSSAVTPQGETEARELEQAGLLESCPGLGGDLWRATPAGEQALVDYVAAHPNFLEGTDACDCSPALPNLATQLDDAVSWCPRCGRMWHRGTGADFEPARGVAGEIVTPVALGAWEARLLLRVVDQVVRETEGSAVPVSDGLLNLRDKLAETLGRLLSIEQALRRQISAGDGGLTGAGE